MKILVLTLSGEVSRPVYIILDKIEAFVPEKDGSRVWLVDGDFFVVKETAGFIAKQICSANTTDYSIYNSKEGI